MGLLDKASQSQKGSEAAESLLHSIDTEQKKKIFQNDHLDSVQWLTQQAFHTPADTDSVNKSAPFITAEEKSIIAKITALKEGVETPGRIYALLKEELYIEKGAFLVQDKQSDIFIPWALTGYDTTTRSRLRIPRTALQSNFSEHTTDCIYIDSEEERMFLRPFFSIREFGLLEQVLFCPFVHAQEIIGFLLITESPVLAEDSMDRSLSFVQSVVKTASPVLYNTRERKLQNISLLQPSVQSDLKREITGIYTSAATEGKELLILVFSIQKAVERIHQYVEDADSFRIRHDLSGILTSMFSETGGVYSAGEANLLLILTGKSLKDESLLVHQISLAMNDFTQQDLDVKNLIEDTLINPENEQALLHFLEKWI